MGIFSTIASLVVKGVKSIPKILASTISGIGSAIDTWNSYNTIRMFNGLGENEDIDKEEKQKLVDVLRDNYSEMEVKTFLNTIDNVVSLKKDASNKTTESQCDYILTSQSKTKELNAGTVNIALCSSSDANQKTMDQNNTVFSCPFVANLDIQLNTIPTESNLNAARVSVPQNFDDPDSYVKLDNIKLNQNNTSMSTNMTLDGPVYQISTMENDLIPLLKLSYNFKDNEVDDFIKKISLIWGNHTGFKAYISKVLKSIKAFFLDTVRSNAENAVLIDTLPDGTLEVKNYEENKVDRIQLGTTAVILDSDKNCSINTKQQVGNYVTTNNGFAFPKKVSETIEFKQEKYRLSFIKKHELIELAKLYIKKDVTFDKILLKLCYKYRHTSGLHAVFKKGELNRFVSTEQLNDLEEDEEYEENNVRFFFI